MYIDLEEKKNMLMSEYKFSLEEDFIISRRYGVLQGASTSSC